MIGVIKKAFISDGFDKNYPEIKADNDVNNKSDKKDTLRSVVKIIFQSEYGENFYDYKKDEDYHFDFFIF